MEASKKIEIILKHINKHLALEDQAYMCLRTGLMDGLIEIEGHRCREEKIRESEFAVEQTEDGFAIWISGGRRKDKDRWESVLAAGPEGQKLKVIKRINTDLDRRSLAVLYQGCYIVETFMEDALNCSQFVYAVLGFGCRKGRWVAVCRMVSTDNVEKTVAGQYLWQVLNPMMDKGRTLAVSGRHDRTMY